MCAREDSAFAKSSHRDASRSPPFIIVVVERVVQQLMEPGMRRPPSPPAGWRSIRPWNRLTLHVREITPVSVTFILSSSIALRTWEDSDELDDSDHASPSQHKPPVKPLSMSELLRKGLAVKVNNAPWQTVVMHIDDDADTEAIVILYGLHPARTYDVELALVATDDSIRGKVSTEAACGTFLPPPNLTPSPLTYPSIRTPRYRRRPRGR